MQILFLGTPTTELADFMQNFGDEVLPMDGPLDVVGLQKIDPDLIVSFGYRHILRREILELYPRKFINLHISYLPWNRGADPNFWSFVENTPKGVSIHFIDEGIDTGDIIAQKQVQFSGGETLKCSYEKLQSEIILLFKENWELIRNGTSRSFPQAGEGSFHTAVDKNKYAFLSEKLGYETPISVLEEFGKTQKAN